MASEYKPPTITQHLKNGTKQVILPSELKKVMTDNINTEKVTIEADKSYNHRMCIHVRSGTGEYYAPKFNTRFEGI